MQYGTITECPSIKHLGIVACCITSVALNSLDNLFSRCTQRMRSALVNTSDFLSRKLDHGSIFNPVFFLCRKISMHHYPTKNLLIVQNRGDFHHQRIICIDIARRFIGYSGDTRPINVQVPRANCYTYGSIRDNLVNISILSHFFNSLTCMVRNRVGKKVYNSHCRKASPWISLCSQRIRTESLPNLQTLLLGLFLDALALHAYFFVHG